jgi:hypothetical protein
MENYGVNPVGALNHVGFGIVLEDVINSQITKNQIYSFYDAIYCQNANIGNIIFNENILVDNLNTDFGGFVPQFSRMSDNIGVPWLTSTPSMPGNSDGTEATVRRNTAPYPQQIFITGGTVFGVNINGTNVNLGGPAWAIPIILMLEPQHFIAISYTVTPSWIWVPMI